MRFFILIAVIFTALLGFSQHADAQYFGIGFGMTTTTFGTSRHGPAKYDPRIDPKLIKAARLAENRAGRHTTLHCWQYVKDALVQAGAVHSRPATAYAYQAGAELVEQGFVKINVNDPYSAPLGSVLVYGDHGAGHVEFRTANGFASDYKSNWRCKYHLIGVYAKMS